MGMAMEEGNGNIKFGGFWVRLFAFLVDGVILWVARYPIIIIFWAISDDFSLWGGLKRGAANSGLNALYMLINLGIFFAYFVIMDVRYRATLGKMLLGLKVVGTDLEQISYGKAALREIVGKAVSVFGLFIGFVWIGFDSRKQGWHDKIAETYAIRQSVEE